ncbi:MAG: hypothetical protein NC920_04490, partial [Candidatus Omnitrophica bacterium]|nr:hypothetical protein [Candidatus Omnitrophota bacterium]
MKKVLVLLGIMVLFCAVRSEASMIEIGQNPLVISTQKGNDKPPVYSVPVLIEPGNVRVKSVGKLIEAILRSQNKLTQLREFKNLLNNLNLDNYNAEAGFNLVYEVTEGKKEVQILGGKLSVELILTPKNKIDIKVIRVGLNFDLN